MPKLCNLFVAVIIYFIGVPSMAQISKQQATDIVLNQIVSVELDKIDVFMINETKSSENTIILENNKTVVMPFTSNWVFFIDDRPFANWAHPCRYIFIDVASGNHQIINQNFFPHDWKTAYSVISEIARPTPINLPVNPNAVINGLDPNPNLYAVLINGSSQDEGRYWNDISAIYCTLIDVYGYKKENIFVHFGFGYSFLYGEDLDNDGSSDFDYNALKPTIRHTFDEMAGITNTSDEIPKLRPEDQLFIFVTDHGYIEEGHSYLNLPYNTLTPDNLKDTELAGYLEEINCAQMIVVMEPCEIGGFVTELSDFENYDVLCENRSIHTASDIRPSYPEVWFTALNYDEFVYYWTAAARGYYPDELHPWEVSIYPVGEFPFELYFDDHPGDYYPDINGDGFVQMDEAFDYANNLDSWSTYGYYYPYNSGLFEDPRVFSDIYFADDLQTLSGIAGNIETTQIIDERNFLVGGNLSVGPDVNLTLDEDAHLFFGNEIAGLTVEESATLNIKSEIIFSKDSYLRIKPGGMTFVDGGRLTTNVDSDSYWQGIEVWGNTDEHQWTDSNGKYMQGYIELNNAIIDNAICALNLWKPGDYEKTGGIVVANNSTFYNNQRSVHALCYNNFHPESGKPMDYNATFNKCKFIVNESYIPTNIFYKHVDLNQVNGVRFNGCDFLLKPDAQGVSNYNHAIAAYSAGFKVNAICEVATQNGCAEYDPCTFTGFRDAISAYNGSGLTNTFYVNRAEFNNNNIGIDVSNVWNPIIINSNFYLDNNKYTEESCSYGIHLDNSTGFAIEENKFFKATGAPLANYFGIAAINCPTIVEIYKNEFTGLSAGNYAYGQNWENDNTTGLAYLCNKNRENYADFYVTGIEGDVTQGIQSKQGSEIIPAGNEFSSSGAYLHFYNSTRNIIDYYYCSSCPNQQPNLIVNTALHPVNTINPCRSHYGGDSGREVVLNTQQKMECEASFAMASTNYDNVKVLFDNLKDGGSTTTKVSEISNATVDDMWALRAELLGDSPHLSEEVLKLVADKTDVFTEAAIFDILAANPDELKKEELIKYLEEKENPLPSYMIDILRQVAEGNTYKTVLQQEMSRYSHDRARAATDIIRSILNDETTDIVQLRNWLDNLGGIESDKQIIGSYVQEGNFSSAFALANLLPSLYNLQDAELAEYNRYIYMLQLQQTFFNEGRTMDQLTQNEQNMLNEFALVSEGDAGAQAKGILETYYGVHFNSCKTLSGEVSYKNDYIDPNLLSEAYGLTISVKPNPAIEWAAFDFSLPNQETSGILEISDVTGRNIMTFNLDGNKGQKLWDTREILAGSYIFTIKAAGFIKSGKLIITK